MKKAFLFLICFLLAIESHTGSITPATWMQVLDGSAASAPAASYLLNQNFEGAGYDNSETWTETLASGTVDEDYTSTILAGSQSLRITGAGFTARTGSPTFSAVQVCYGYMLFRPVTLPASGFETSILDIRSAGNLRFGIVVLTDGTLRIAGNVSGSQSCTTKLSAGTTYHIWWSVDTTSSPESVTLGFSTTGTRPTGGNTYVAGTVECTDGAAIDNVVVQGVGGGSSPTPDAIFDRVLVDDVQIGNNP